MKNYPWTTIPVVLCLACIQVPQQENPENTTRKATVTVDHRGAVVEGGNLIITIPEGALQEGERIKVTIDLILGAPARHLGETYLVQPEGQVFDLPVTVGFRYSNKMVADIADLDRLFVGVASGLNWEPTGNPEHNTERKIVQGEVNHFSVFGLVDPAMAVDGGQPDTASRTDGPQTDGAAYASIPVWVELTWNTGDSDLDLHLLRENNPQTADDCYYANCTGDGGLEWPPAGPAGNPFMSRDDQRGYGPENIVIAQPSDGSFIAAVHAWSYGEEQPTTYSLRIFKNAQQLFASSGSLDETYMVLAANITVADQGNSVTVEQRSDAPFIP